MQSTGWSFCLPEEEYGTAIDISNNLICLTADPDINIFTNWAPPQLCVLSWRRISDEPARLKACKLVSKPVTAEVPSASRLSP